MDNKHRLRATLRARRRAHVAQLPDSARALVFHRPPGPLLARLGAPGVIGLYHAMAREAPTLGYARWFFENGWQLALPWFAARDAAMGFRRWADPYDEAALAVGPFGAAQPADADEVVPDAVIVPLLGFTTACDRLGQGGGHYDRWLAAHPAAIAIGLAWDCQLAESLPVEPHDRVLDAVVTPARFYLREAA